MPADQVEAYFARLQDESFLVFLDMMFLRLPRPHRVKRVPMLVLDCSGDQQFTPAEVLATARAYHAESEVFRGMAHDMMLEPGWEGVANRIIDWLRNLPGIC
jgi:hypothetical protein